MNYPCYLLFKKLLFHFLLELLSSKSLKSKIKIKIHEILYWLRMRFCYWGINKFRLLIQDFVLSRHWNVAQHPSIKAPLYLCYSCIKMHLITSLHLCVNFVKLRMKFWKWNPCNSTLVLLEMQQINFLILISLDKEDLELFTR